MGTSTSTSHAERLPPFARSRIDSTGVALCVIALLGAMYALISRYALDGFPYSGDEYSTTLQAELFARGVLKAAAPEHIEWLRVDHVVIDTFVRSKYPPGASALLALGVRGGAAWLVTPVEGVVGLIVLWHTTRRLLGPRAALVALFVIGLAPLYAFQAASFYAHTATTMFLAFAFAGVVDWSQTRRWRGLVVAGAAIGCAFLTRPIDAVAFGLAMIVFRSWRALAFTAACALPFVAAALVYQNAQFGSPFTDGYHAYAPTFAALYGADHAANPISIQALLSPVEQWNHLDVCRAFIMEWTVPGTAVVALLGALALTREHTARPVRSFAIALIALQVGTLLWTIAGIDDGARPRYLSQSMIPVGFLAAAGFAPACVAIESRLGKRIRRILVTLAVLFGLAKLAAVIEDRVPRVWMRHGLARIAERQQLDNAVVIVRADYPGRLARNGPWFDGSILYLSPPPTVAATEIAVAYPEREIWEAYEGSESWRLVRVR